jgi:hypothetical protein
MTKYCYKFLEKFKRQSKVGDLMTDRRQRAALPRNLGILGRNWRATVASSAVQQTAHPVIGALATIMLRPAGRGASSYEVQRKV